MTSRVHRIVGRLRQIASEIDYAQRRLLEIRTGLALTPETERALARAHIARLEALYAAGEADLEPLRAPEPGRRADRHRRPPARK